jgi:hypothetical protein
MKEVYSSQLILPLLPFLTAPIAFLLGLRLRSLLGVIIAAFAIEIALDAWLTGSLSPLHAPAGLEWVVPVVFVILGDLRYFVVVEACTPRPVLWRSALLSLALAFVVPVTTQIARALFKRVHDDESVNYLVYELLFFLLAIVMRLFVVPPRMEGSDAGARTLALRVSEFEIVQYGLWACADIVILSGLEGPGYALRIVPNVLYYVGFLFFVFFFSSRSPRSSAA